MPAPGFESYGEAINYTGELPNGNDPNLEQPITVQQSGYQGANVDLKNLEWRAINGPFVSIWLHNVPWGGEDALAAPDAKVRSILDTLLPEICSLLMSTFFHILLTFCCLCLG